MGNHFLDTQEILYRVQNKKLEYRCTIFMGEYRIVLLPKPSHAVADGLYVQTSSGRPHTRTLSLGVPASPRPPDSTANCHAVFSSVAACDYKNRVPHPLGLDP